MCISCMLSCARDYMPVALYHSLGSGTLLGRMQEGVFIKPRLIGFCLRCHDKPVETMKDLWLGHWKHIYIVGKHKSISRRYPIGGLGLEVSVADLLCACRLHCCRLPCCIVAGCSWSSVLPSGRLLFVYVLQPS